MKKIILELKDKKEICQGSIDIRQNCCMHVTSIHSWKLILN